MTPLVTVYMPTHNRRALVERALDSVLRQDHPAVEVIVVNDASTDDTATFLDDFAARDARVRVLHQAKAGGAPAARNRAIALAAGTFITGLDDDDEFAPTRLSQLVAAWNACVAAGPPPACLFTQAVSLHGTRAILSSGQRPRLTYNDLFVSNFIGNQVFAPTEHFRDVGGFDERMPAWQDLELFIRLLKRHGDAVLVPSPTYITHITAGLERISGNPARVRAAYDRLSAKYPELPASLHHALFLQMFSPHYGTVPSGADFAFLLRRRAFGSATLLAGMAMVNGRRKAKAAVLARLRR